MGTAPQKHLGYKFLEETTAVKGNIDVSSDDFTATSQLLVLRSTELAESVEMCSCRLQSFRIRGVNHM